jgi:hypothetical protein
VPFNAGFARLHLQRSTHDRGCIVADRAQRDAWLLVALLPCKESIIAGIDAGDGRHR